ncbi:MAG: IPExxxVDY family protein [Bacteroidota bacterium]
MVSHNRHLSKREQLITPYPLEDVTVMGITTSLKHYKLAWLINQTASLKLTQVTEAYYDTPEQANGHTLHFLCKTAHCAFTLVKNGLGSYEGAIVGYLIPQLRRFDFFFAVQDATATFQVEVFRNSLSAMQQITYLTQLPEKKWHRTDLLRVLGY